MLCAFHRGYPSFWGIRFIDHLVFFGRSWDDVFVVSEMGMALFFYNRFLLHTHEMHNTCSSPL